MVDLFDKDAGDFDLVSSLEYIHNIKTSYFI